MIAIKSALRASIFVLLLVNHTPAYAKDVFKSSEFMTWSEGNRSLYIRTSIGMAGLIAGYNDKKHMTCLENWYLRSEKESNEFIYQAMKKFPDFHPRGVIMAVLEKKCGTFEYSARKR